MAGKKNCAYATGNLNNLNVQTEIAGQKDCLFVTGKTETVNVLPVNSSVITHVPFVGGLQQKKGENSDIVPHPEIKYVNDVSCVDHLSSVKCLDYFNKVGDEVRPSWWPSVENPDLVFQ